MVRIESGGISSRVQSTPLGLSQRPAQAAAAAVGKQVSQALFGRPPPPRLDPQNYPHLAAMLRQLGRFQRKFAALAGDQDHDYQLVLADFPTAAVDADGTIYLGAQFLEENRDHPEVILGALAHEIGHQPKRWRVGQRPRRQRGQQGQQQGQQQEPQADDARQLSADELDELCQIEETRADLFAGEALAELGYSCEPLVAYLKDHESGPHRRYLPAADRAEIIRQAHQARHSTLKQRRQMFPDYERHRAARGHVGSL